MDMTTPSERAVRDAVEETFADEEAMLDVALKATNDQRAEMGLKPLPTPTN